MANEDNLLIKTQMLLIMLSRLEVLMMLYLLWKYLNINNKKR
jgi:hypothetical protein